MPEGAAATSAIPTITSRKQLVCVLRSAAELEHLLTCQYLFAAFSLRKTLDDFPPEGSSDAKQLVMARNQRWGYKVLEISRQEMEHLGIVTNLLGALGEPPFFDRPNFPVPSTYLPIGAPFVLERFNVQTLQRFLAYERPDYLSVPAAWSAGGPPADCLKSRDCGIVFRDVQQLYEEIGNAFQTLPADELFVGDSRRQPDSTNTPALTLDVNVLPVTDRDTAAQAIALILEQGEGIGEFPLSTTGNHFSSFNAILQELLDAGGAFEPALPVVYNPSLESRDPCTGATIVTDPYTRRAMAFFNHAYELMLVFLKGFFAGFLDFFGPPAMVTGLDPMSDFQQRTRNAALVEQAFFPFMTMVLRPLGEILCRLPAFEGEPDGPRAGPSFELVGGKLRTIEDLPAALDELARAARVLADDAPTPGLRGQLQYIADNIYRMSQNFSRVWFAVRLGDGGAR